MSFKPIGSLLGSLTKRSKTPEAILALQVRQVAKETIERQLFDVPKDLVDLIRVRSFKNGLLVVNAPPLLAVELSMRSRGLEKAINRTLGGVIVRSLRFKSS